HELRTPLSAIVGWAEMLRTGTLDDDRRKKAVDTILRSARTQAQLIEDLLDVSRIVAGTLRLRTGPVELTALLHAAIDMVRPMATGREVELRVAAAASGAVVTADAERLQQVFWNLLVNAV